MPDNLKTKLASRIEGRTSTDLLNMQLGLENIKRHSFENTVTGNTLGNASVRSGSVEDKRLNNGKPTLIPFLYEGRVVNVKEAVERAVESGRIWPAFDTNDEATMASKKISNRLKLRGEQ